MLANFQAEEKLHMSVHISNTNKRTFKKLIFPNPHQERPGISLFYHNLAESSALLPNTPVKIRRISRVEVERICNRYVLN
jgi:hypothetical protein